LATVLRPGVEAMIGAGRFELPTFFTHVAFEKGGGQSLISVRQLSGRND
jgi:hypothetical protein